jgi:site-specific recombinase XerD
LAKAAAVLRRFLAYAFEQEWCSRDLSGSVLSPRLFRFENLPLGPSWPDVERLVAAAEGGSPRQLRNRAMLLLLAVYGLRSGEVRGLCLRDLDWDRRILRVHRTKTARVQEYPLTAAMSQALRRYLKEGRPVSTCPEVFLTLHQAVEQCIDLKRSLGFRFRSDSTILKAFSRAMGNVTLGQVKPGAVRAYLDGSGPVTRHWYRKWEALRPFYRFTLSRGLVRRSPLPIQAPKLAVTFTAYIYTQRELPAILQAVTPGRTGR